jgi:hypothetical protein
MNGPRQWGFIQLFVMTEADCLLLRGQNNYPNRCCLALASICALKVRLTI